MAAFRAMGTEVTVLAPSLDEAAEQSLARRVAAVFEAEERRYSRFRDDSELSALNRAAGGATVSAPLFAALVRARGYFELTDGLFDPAIGGALEALGYDRSFASGALDRATPGAPCHARRATLADVALDPRTRRVGRPAGLRLDLGGMIKGATADLASRLLPVPGALDAGGDGVLRGDGPDGAGWCVDVEDPADARRVLLTLRVRDRAVATSAPNRRRWRAGAGDAHHLVDPRTGRSSTSDLAQATVFAPHAELADVLAKTVFFLGARAGRRWLERRDDVAAVLVDRDGRVTRVGALEVLES